MKNQHDLVDSLSKIFWDTDLIGTRFTLALAEFFWGFFLAISTEPMWPHSSSIQPNALNSATSFLLLVTAVIRISILVNGTSHCRLSRYFDTWSMGLWLVLTYNLMFAVYPPPPSAGGAIALFLGAGWIWLRPYILSEGYKRVESNRSPEFTECGHTSTSF